MAPTPKPIDRQAEAIRALEMFLARLGAVAQDASVWKWAIRALHDALEHLMVCAIRDPASLGEERAGAASWPPEVFAELYVRIKRDTGYAPAPEIDHAVGRLHDLREAIIMEKTSWSVAVDLPHVCRGCLDVIEALAWNPGHVRWQDAEHEVRSRRLVDSSRDILAALEVQGR